MSLVNRYLNINPIGFDNFVDNNFDIKSLIQYQNFFCDINTTEKIIQYVDNMIIEYIDDFNIKLNSLKIDINYYIEQIYIFVDKKMIDVYKFLDIDHLISAIDYNNDSSFYKIKCQYFYDYLYEKIFNSKYKFFNKSNESTLYDLFISNYNNITFDNIINFYFILNKFKYYNKNIDKFTIIISDEFDKNTNIVKLLKYINNHLILSYGYDTPSKMYNTIQSIIDNLKSNGFLLFEQYFKIIKEKYKISSTYNILEIQKDIALVRFFMVIITKKDNNNVNRYVNDMLIKIKEYLYDIEDNYNNNIAFRQINIQIKSKKYTQSDINKVKRNICNFKILQYSNIEDNMPEKYTMNHNIEIYYDIYKSYYKLRYPNRKIDFDIIKSTIISKIKFLDKSYIIHMSIIQYMVLDLIYNSNDTGISVFDISKLLNIDLVVLQNTFNSLLKIQIIKRSIDETNTNNIIFKINKSCTFDNLKVSISDLVIQPKKVEKITNFLHDRNMIILTNIVDYAKKNKFFNSDVFFDIIGYKIPFKINRDFYDKCIQEAIDKDFIQSEKLDDSSDIIYRYID